MSEVFVNPEAKYDYDEDSGMFSKKAVAVKERLKVLAWCDTPTCSTGFGQVAKNIFKILGSDKYDINVLGINHGGDAYDTAQFPYRIDPATCLLSNDTDLHGRPKLLRKIKNERFDILFIIQDTFLVQTVIGEILKIRKELPLDRQFAIIYYYPIDGVPQGSWIRDTVMAVDFPVVYTEYGKKLSYDAVDEKFPLDVIGHGTNKKDFYPLPSTDAYAFRKEVFKEHAEDFLVLNVNRNQQRKDLHRSFAAYGLFHAKYPNSFYFVNAQMNDIGGHIGIIAQQYGLFLPDKEKGIKGDWAAPAEGTFSASQGYTIPIVNGFYNAVDLVISTTLGEGWGLSCTEAMAVKKPVLFPRNTSLIEMIGENEERGYMCKSGADLEHLICLGGMDNNIVRPTVDVQDMANKMEYIYLNYAEAKIKAEAAFEWCASWEDLAPQWRNVFDRAEAKINEMRGVNP